LPCATPDFSLLSACAPQVVRETQLVVQTQLVEVTAAPTLASTTPEGPPEKVALINTYLAAWSEPNAPERLRLLESVWEETGTYTDPTSELADRDALDAAIGQFLLSYPGAVASIAGPVEAYGRHVHFPWVIQFENGTKLPGHDYGELSRDGKFAKIVGFF
jgi:hypothetical protein